MTVELRGGSVGTVSWEGSFQESTSVVPLEKNRRWWLPVVPHEEAGFCRDDGPEILLSRIFCGSGEGRRRRLSLVTEQTQVAGVIRRVLQGGCPWKMFLESSFCNIFKRSNWRLYGRLMK